MPEEKTTENKSKCSVEDCNREVYENNKCILHCPKETSINIDKFRGIYHRDRLALLPKFFDELIDYVVKKVGEDKVSHKELKDYLINTNFNNERYKNLFKEILFIPTHIHFPIRDNRDWFDYSKILNLFEEIHFNYCEFYDSTLDLEDIKCFFQDCKFHFDWTLYNYSLWENEDNVIYQTCEFYKNVSNYISEEQKELAIYDYSQFDYTCKFYQYLNFDRSIFKNKLFNILKWLKKNLKT